MTFLNFALLGGIAALAIPIIIHLFHKSRFQIVKWGAMHLLEAVIRTNRRRIRIEQLILLAIRAAIPVLLALAMARPVWVGAQKLLGNAKTSTVVLLDSAGLHQRGDAMLRLARHLGGGWGRLAAVAGIVPRGVREGAYGFVAARRQRWFGCADACALATPAERERFLD